MPVGADAAFLDRRPRLLELVRALTSRSWNLSPSVESLAPYCFPFVYFLPILLTLQEREQDTLRRIVLLQSALVTLSG